MLEKKIQIKDLINEFFIFVCISQHAIISKYRTQKLWLNFVVLNQKISSCH